MTKRNQQTKHSHDQNADSLQLQLEPVSMEPPVKAPSKLAKTNAEEDPKKTAIGLLEVPLIVRVANCVLSPNSAIKTVKNVDSNRLKIIYK